MSYCSDLTRERIMECAKVEFLKKGFQATQLKDIVTAAKVTTGAIYRHFKDKEALFFALIEDVYHYTLGQHRTIAEASAVESPIRQETIGFPAHFFARAHNFKPPGRACQPEADSPMRT